MLDYYNMFHVGASQDTVTIRFALRDVFAKPDDVTAAVKSEHYLFKDIVLDKFIARTLSQHLAVACTIPTPDNSQVIIPSETH